jgi:hypothetical protein
MVYHCQGRNPLQAAASARGGFMKFSLYHFNSTKKEKNHDKSV